MNFPLFKLRYVSDLALSAVVIAATVWVLRATAARQLTYGSQAAGWIFCYYSYSPLEITPIFTGLALSILSAVLLPLTMKSIQKYEYLTLLIWLAFGMGSQLALHSLNWQSLTAVFVDPANAYWDVSGRFGAFYLLTHWRSMVTELPYHVGSNMPGKILLFGGIRLLTNQPRTAALAVLLLYDSGGLFLYGLVARLYKDRSTALIAFVLYLFIPAVTYFVPLLNVISGVPMLAALWILVLFLEIGRPALAWMLGVLLYLAIFFDPMALLFGLLFVALIGAAWHGGRCKPAAVAVPTMLGFGLADFGMRLLFHFDLIETFQLATANAEAYATMTPPRYYVPWLLPNTFEFFLSAGIGTSLACLSYGLLGNRKMPGVLIFGTTLATIALMVLSGLVGGEVVRIWICAMPLLAMIAADVLRDRPVARAAVLSSIICQTAITIWMVSFIGFPAEPVARTLAWF